MKIIKKGIFHKAPKEMLSEMKALTDNEPEEPPIKKLGFVASHQKGKSSLKMMVHKAVARYEEPRSPHVLHASDLMKDGVEFCPREHALLRLGVSKKKKQFVGTALAITYQHGRDLEHHIRNQWLREHVVGYWRCGVCSNRSNFGKAPKTKCGKCGWGSQWTYEEVRFESSVSGISCGIDVLVNTGELKFRIGELKTLDKDAFKKLVAPLAEHRFRTSLYMKLVEESTLPFSPQINTSEAALLYTAKSFGVKDESMKQEGIPDSAFSPFKEFVIKRDDAIVESAVNKAIALKTWQDTPEMGLPCGVCANGMTKRAQQCSAASACWSGKYPQAITWMEGGTLRHPGKILA